MRNHTARIDIWHNILWSKYKGEVFSAVNALADKQKIFDIHFFQIAETEGNRVGLASVDMSNHRYPFTLLFKGSYDNISISQRLYKIGLYTLRSKADLILITGYEKPEGWIQLLITKLTGRKAAVFVDSTIYDQPQKYFRGLLKKIFFRSVDGIFGYGQRSKEYVIHYGANPEKVFHRCQAAALPHDYTPEKAFADRIRLTTDANAPRFLYVGRLSPEKSLDTLLKAFAKLYKQHQSAKLIIVGSGPSLEDLNQLTQALGITNNVVFAGSKSGAALFEEYSKATAFVLPSTSEPWGLVVNEALAYGCPVIVSQRCGCVPELVIDGKTGYTHAAENIEDLSSKMLSAIANFSDVKATAQNCIKLMANYIPSAAATQILIGCKKILGIAES